MKIKKLNFWPALPVLILLAATATSRLLAAAENPPEEDGPDFVPCCEMCVELMGEGSP